MTAARIGTQTQADPASVARATDLGGRMSLEQATEFAQDI